MPGSREFSAKERGNFKKAIEQHGYAFQQAVIHAIKTARFPDNGARWVFVDPEFPYQVGGEPGHADFILQWVPPPAAIMASTTVYLVVECKRANPKYGQWLFAKGITGRPATRFVVDGIERTGPDRDQMLASACKVEVNPRLPSHHIFFNVATDKEANLFNKNWDKTEQAIRQAVAAANGLINYRIHHKSSMAYNSLHVVIPMLVTTAELIAVESNLAPCTQVSDGNLVKDLEYTRAPYIYAEYYADPAVRHDLASQLVDRDISDIVGRQYARTVPIVRGDQVVTFLMKWEFQVTKMERQSKEG